MEKEKKGFSIRGSTIKEDLYYHLLKKVNECGSFKDAIEYLLQKDIDDNLGVEFCKVKNELKSEMSVEIKEELKLLKQYIGEQFNKRSFTTESKHQQQEEIEDTNKGQVYNPEELKITGNAVEEDAEIDF